jgi:hypothetical protein
VKAAAGRRALPLERLLFLALYCWAFLYGLRPIHEYDFWWHLASGRRIIETLRVPFVDPFSLTCRGARWVDSYWLFEAALYGLFRLAGFNGIVVAAAAAGAAALGFQQRMLAALGTGWAARAAVLVLFFLSFDPAAHGWVSLSSLVTLVFCSALWAELETGRRDRAAPRLALWLPLFALWANLHRGVVVGLAVAGLYAVFDAPRGAQTLPRRLAFPLLAAAATLLNPYGVGLYRMIWSDFTVSPLHVHGWSAPRWSSQPFYAAAIVALWLVLALRLLRRERNVGFHAAAAAFFTVLGARNIVHAPYLLLFALPLVAATASDEFRRRPELRLPAAVERGLLFASLALALFGAAAAKARGGVDAASVPAAACDFIAREGVRGPFYNDYRFGGYWIWRFNGSPPVLIDGRYPAVDGYEALLADIEAAKKSPAAWEDFLRRRGLHAVLSTYPEGAPTSAMFDAYFPRARWALVYWDDAALVFLERTPENLPTIRREEFRALSPDGGPEVLAARVRAAAPATRRLIAAELERSARDHPDSARVERLARAFLDAAPSPAR